MRIPLSTRIPSVCHCAAALRSALLLLSVFTPVSLSAAAPPVQDLAEMSLTELMDITVTSASKKPEKRSEVATALYVITHEDIQRSGVTSIPEALRLAPGVHVARIDSSRWAVSIRGFTDRFTNKLLVLIDGRSVYTPFFGGVYWELQDTVLADIDRIEIIRGPGGTLWGSNAVNGVINIITKSSADTQGGLLTLGGGNEEQGFVSFRHGGQVDERLSYRLYSKYFRRDGGAGSENFDDWEMVRAGFRSDWTPSDDDTVTLQGDIYEGRIGQRVTVASPDAPFALQRTTESPLAGGNLLGRWTHHQSSDSRTDVQFYYDRTHRKEALFREDRDTINFDFQHLLRVPDWAQEIVWGLGYRLTVDDFHNTYSVRLLPAARRTQFISAFLQDEITLWPERLSVALGSKIEYNDFTGFEYQPRAQLLYTPSAAHTFWASVSRAVRIPTRIDNDMRIRLAFDAQPPAPPGTVLLAHLRGNTALEAEDLLAYEAGYRTQPLPSVFFDLSLFFNRYQHLIGFDADPSPSQPVIPPAPSFTGTSSNNDAGDTFGGEIALTWQVREWWSLHNHYALLRSTHIAMGASPHHQASSRSHMQLPYSIGWDVWVRYVESVPARDVGSYVTADTQVTYRLNEALTFSLVGQNLIEAQHREFTDTIFYAAGSAVERSVYGKVAWQF